MDIRKISIGPDYKNGAMHYLVGQKILGESNEIHLIKYNEERKSVQIYIINKRRGSSLERVYLYGSNFNRI